MSLYTIRRFLFTAIPAAFLGIAFSDLGEWVAGPLHMNEIALSWTLLLMASGSWGWYSDRIYDALFVRSKQLAQSAALGESTKEKT